VDGRSRGNAQGDPCAGEPKSGTAKAEKVVAALKSMKLGSAAQELKYGVEETLTYTGFPREHWTRIRTNNGIERIMREIRRRTRVVGCFPDGNSALMLACARLRHVSSSAWSDCPKTQMREKADRPARAKSFTRY